MTQDDFVAARRGAWDELDELLRRVQRVGARRVEPGVIARLPGLYRALAGDLARAEGAGFSADVVEFLERLAARAHAVLYAAAPWRWRAAWDFLAGGFPRALRARAGFLAVAAALFTLPLVLGFAGALASPTFAQRVLPASALAQAAESFGDGYGAGRGDGEGALMTGLYVYNNVGIAFRCFATGVFFGLGSAFFLVYNGAVIGTTLGYVAALGYGRNIASFVASHSPFELTAVVIAGAAGLQLGYALVRTRGETRLGSLRRQGPEILRLVLGAAGMLAVAALVEGLWSGSALPATTKLLAGAAAGLWVGLYLTLAGRPRGPAAPREARRGAAAG